MFVTWCLRIDRCCCHMPARRVELRARNARPSKLTVDPQPHLHTHLGICDGDTVFHVCKARWTIARPEFAARIQHPCPSPFTSRLDQFPFSFPTPDFDQERGTHQFCPSVDLSEFAEGYDSGIILHPRDGYYVLDVGQFCQLSVCVGIPDPHASISTWGKG